MRKLLFFLALLSSAPATAQDAVQGEALYSFYCATCHGKRAVGNGPMSPSLMVAPTDLTQLAASNEGVFPTVRVIMRIDGRDPMVSHGSMMPVYGDFFEGNEVFAQGETGQPIMTSQPIVDLLAYLQTLQQE